MKYLSDHRRRWNVLRHLPPRPVRHDDHELRNGADGGLHRRLLLGYADCVRLLLGSGVRCAHELHGHFHDHHMWALPAGPWRHIHGVPVSWSQSRRSVLARVVGHRESVAASLPASLPRHGVGSKGLLSLDTMGPAVSSILLS